MIVAKKTAIEFHIKKIYLANIRPEVLNKIYKFPFPLQRVVAEEVYTIAKKLEEGKCLPNLGGLKIYQTCGIVEIPVVQTPAANKVAKKSQSKMNELFERTRDYYYKLVEKCR
ncbi:3669_t:CDS:2 [Dentiscutata erythropus]|uniref:3669_t:CDS:1 n=1 Tax=Dentiscutata erythropus TaxID=1348616 RepID=A0A9N9I4F8_9GLOM|nr:3669_t:CDS:2 [Dentiscutata erythropus]